MSEPNEPPDDLGELLAPRVGPPNPALRAAILRRTERRLAWVRWARRVTTVAVLAAVFAAGGAAGWFARPPAEPVPAPEVQVIPVPVAVPVLVPETSAPPAEAFVSAGDAELRAEQADGVEAANLYRTAGDLFLRTDDYPNAARCYRLFLTRAGDSGLSPDPADTWLLTSLKNAAYKETVHAPKVVD